MSPNDIAARVAREQKRHLDDQRIDEMAPFVEILATFAAIGLLLVIVLLVVLAKGLVE